MMPTSAPGNKHRGTNLGFSLLELMVVVMLVALAAGLTILSLRDPAQSKLEEEGARLSALLESARTQSRIVGTEVRWEPATIAGGFRFIGLPEAALSALPRQWLDPQTHAEVMGEAQLRLGPEPLLYAQRVVLRLGQHQLAVGTDGLAPFSVIEQSTVPDASAATP